MTKKHDKTPIFRIDVAAAGDWEPYVIQEIGSSQRFLRLETF